MLMKKENPLQIVVFLCYNTEHGGYAMNDFLFYLFVISFLAAPAAFAVAVIFSVLKKKKAMSISWVTFGGIVALVLLSLIVHIATGCRHEYELVEEIAPSCTANGITINVCAKCGNKQRKYSDALGHDLRIASRIEPTLNLDGEIVRDCARCGYEEVEVVARLEPTPSPTPSPTPTPEPTAAPTPEPAPSPSPADPDGEIVDTSVTFDEIYKAFKQNELVAKEKYNGNRYKITAKINGMNTGGLFNLTGGATLTMEKKVGNTTVFFYAEFEKDQEEALKKVVVGDTITFYGECWGGRFSDCELILE
jgi:hypothetical protein